jgi:hypothetical protein
LLQPGHAEVEVRAPALRILSCEHMYQRHHVLLNTLCQSDAAAQAMFGADCALLISARCVQASASLLQQQPQRHCLQQQ